MDAARTELCAVFSLLLFILYHIIVPSEEIRGVPDQLEDYTDRKLYMHATDQLCKSLSLLRGDLAGVQALNDVAYQLNVWKEVCSIELSP